MANFLPFQNNREQKLNTSESNQINHGNKIVSRSNSSPSYSSTTLQQIQLNLNIHKNKNNENNNNISDDNNNISNKDANNEYNNDIKFHHMPSFSFNNRNRSPSTCSLPMGSMSNLTSLSTSSSQLPGNNKSSSYLFAPVQPADASKTPTLFERNNNFCTKNEKLMPNGNRVGSMLITPPQIVITESKSENDNLDYEGTYDGKIFCCTQKQE